jgi:fatty acid desaturase
MNQVATAADERMRHKVASRLRKTGVDAMTWKRMSGLAVPNAMTSIYLYARTYLVIGLVIAAACHVHNIGISIIAVFLIAARQHTLYILNQDAAHSGLFRSPSANKWTASVLSNFVMLHHPEAWSYVQWRRVHLLHHTRYFTDGGV